MASQSIYLCESDENCGHSVSVDAWASLKDWRDEHDSDDLYIVRSECAEGYVVVQRYGNYCVIRDKREDRKRTR